jgi:glycosyltransferase involved in cell wall biosynthesis
MADRSTGIRVLHLNSLLSGGGTDDQCLRLVQGLTQVGVDASLAGPEGTELAGAVREMGLRFHPTPPEGPLKLRFISAAARLIRQERIQIVHGHHGRDIWPTILAARLSRARPKIVLTRHMAKSPGSWVSRRFLLGQCDALIAVSDFVARVLREGVYEPESPTLERRARPPIAGDHSKIIAIRGGIDTGRFRPVDATAQRCAWGLEPEHFAFAMVGGYDLPRGKGQREFLLAAAQVHEQIPHGRFLIVGRGNMKELLKADILKLGLRGKAWLTPYATDMPSAMNALDCLVHSQIGTEAFGLVLLEAFACGKPVIATALDGIPEAFTMGNLGRLVRPEDVPALARAMLDQAAEPAPTLGGRTQLASQIADKLSFLSTARSVNDLYGRLLSGKRIADPPGAC